MITDPSPPPAADFEQRKANRRAYVIGYRQAVKELELALSEGATIASMRFVLAHQRQHLRVDLTKWANSEAQDSSQPPTVDITIIERSLELMRAKREGRKQRRAYRKGKDLPREPHRLNMGETILSVMMEEED